MYFSNKQKIDIIRNNINIAIRKLLIFYKGSFNIKYFLNLTIDNFIKEIYYCNIINEEQQKMLEDLK